jgi:hypothetical protein
VTAAVVQRPAPRLRAEDTWQALGRAIGEAHASVILREPSEASRRVPESIYPVEVPVTPPQQSAANMSAPFATWPFREGVEPSAAAPDASLSMQVPVRKPRALSTARWAVGGVTAFAALVCAIALATSNGHVEDGAGVQAAAAPPPQTTVIPQKQASSSVSSSSVKDDPLAAAAIANVSSTSWTKNVLDTPGVSVDALPKADSKPKAPARRATKRH